MTHSREFIQALETDDYELLRSIPKTDVHNHFIFGTRRRCIEAWQHVRLEPPPIFSTLDDMMMYARRVLYPYINSQAGAEFTIESAVREAIHDGVTILEMSIDTRFIEMYPGAIQGAIAYLEKIRAQYQESITFRPELGIARDREISAIEHTVQECIASGCFASIDLYGTETIKEPELYKHFYTQAKRAGLKLKAHVGEFGSAESVRQTVEVLELSEVQHGINATDSPDVMHWLARNPIRLNVCPTSNVILSRVPDLQHHPIRKFVDSGITVTINTDDLMIFDQSVSDEYRNLFQAGGFSAKELNQIRTQALESLQTPGDRFTRNSHISGM